MKQGTVKFFNAGKGFGFIIDDETKEEVFVHITALTDGTKELNEGQKVTFEIGQDPRNNKDRAVNVSIVK